MVIGDKLPWGFIFRLHAPWLSATAATTVIAWVLTKQLEVKLPFTPVPFQIAGVALAIFLGFRNNSAYDRWWEGRKLWGGIVNASRSYARQITTLLHGGEPAELKALQKKIVYRHIAWMTALRQALRGEPVGDLSAYLEADELKALSGQKNAAAFLLQRNGEDLAAAARRGWLTEFQLEMIDRSLTELTALQGGCERIKSTPIPTAYRVFTHRFTRVYITFLPLGLIEHMELGALPVVLALSLAFLVLETLGRLLEDPFTLTPNGLALNAITRTIEVNIRQQLGETEVPALLTPESRGGFQVLL
ncbi:MAG: bestrophin family ion channel [Archangium sp.]